MTTATTQKTVFERLIETNITKPGDTIIIHSNRGVLSNSIDCTFSNEVSGEASEKTCIDNIKSNWAWLKRLNGIGGRKVMYQVDIDTLIPYEESTPYKYRFG